MGKGLRPVIVRVVAPILVLAMVLAGCSTVRGGFCAVSSPLRLSAAAVDVLSDTEVKALLAHNRKGQRLCGWTP